MSVALHHSLVEPSNAHLLSNLIVADVSPIQGQISPEFKGYIEAMQKIEAMKLKTRKEASMVLESYEEVLLFIVTSRKGSGTHHLNRILISARSS